jgi:hypothetical protein
MADVSIEDAAKEEWDLVALPGGMPGKCSGTDLFLDPSTDLPLTLDVVLSSSFQGQTICGTLKLSRRFWRSRRRMGNYTLQYALRRL